MIKFGMKPAVHIEGWMWMAGAGLLTVILPAYARSPLFILAAVLDIVLWLLVGMATCWYGDPAMMKTVGGYMLIFSGWYGVYMAGAVVCNTVYAKKVFPLPPDIMK
jgi:succinate-acetate transporter protein